MLQPPTPASARRYESLARLLALLVAFCATLILLGWQVGIALLQGFVPGFPRMNPMTAIGFILLAVAFVLMLPRESSHAQRRAGVFLASLVAVMSVIRLTGILVNRKPDIDEILYAASVNAATSPSRMAEGTALCFVLLAVSLAFIGYRTATGKRPAEFLAFIVGTISVVAMTGYVYGAQPFNGYKLYHSMSFPTSLCFVVLVTAILIARPDQGLAAVCFGDGTGALVARRLIPVAISVPILLGWLRILGQKLGWVDVEAGIALTSAAHVILLTAIVLWTVQVLQRIDDDREVSQSLLRESEDRYRRHSAELEAANKELETFAYSVAHDLRSPLRGMDGFSRILLDEFGEKIGTEGRRYLLRICEGAQRMGELIDDLLSLSRVTRAHMRRERVNLTEIADRIAADLRANDPVRDVRIEIARELYADGDSRLVRMVLDNLIRNAWKFTAKREHAVIEFGASTANGDGLTFFVRDNGAGFDQSHAGKLFGPFQRLHAAHEFPGTGMGLATVKRVVERHGGRAWAEGALEKGATFFFTLPS